MLATTARKPTVRALLACCAKVQRYIKTCVGVYSADWNWKMAVVFTTDTEVFAVSRRRGSSSSQRRSSFAQFEE